MVYNAHCRQIMDITKTITMGRGRGVCNNVISKDCVCTRPYSHILCNVCGFIMEGRIRKTCPIHPLTLFLMDISQCPQCKAHSFMMQEFSNGTK
ncbi:uncharacterized protein CG13380 [Periplaneta americana]|uniref:uncharacterized protein CG13380 n=1 Tax=Periplaneta americana TaxID=6978 RepID=UPI0037E727AB